ncbi:MAG TPA: hypothetical protein GX710_01200 [Clostridiales bacterium]|nr:hypothetical protein [Clostridiales bacterium]
MKRLAMLLVIAITFSLVGCGKTNGKVNEYTTDFFKFSLSDKFERFEKAGKNSDGIWFKYKNKNNGIHVLELSSSNMTVKAYSEDLADSFRSDKSYTSVSCKPYENASLDAYVINLVQEDKTGTHNLDYYILNSQYMNIVVGVSFQDKHSKKLTPLLNDLLQSFEYTDDYYFPTTPQEIENEYFSIKFDPKWVASATGENKEAVHIRYAAAENLDKSFTLFGVYPQIDSEYDTLEEMVQARLEICNNSENYTDIESEESTFLGFNATKISFTINMGKLARHSEFYYFVSNELIYQVSYIVPIVEDAEVMSDIQELIDALVIK